MSPLQRAERRVRVANVNLVSATLLTFVAGAALATARLNGFSETIPEWLVFGTFTFFVVACVLHWRASERLDRVMREAEYLRRMATRASLMNDRTAEQGYRYALAQLVGESGKMAP